MPTVTLYPPFITFLLRFLRVLVFPFLNPVFLNFWPLVEYLHWPTRWPVALEALEAGAVGETYMGNLLLTPTSCETLDNSVSLGLTFPIYKMEQYLLKYALSKPSSHSFLLSSSSSLHLQLCSRLA